MGRAKGAAKTRVKAAKARTGNQAKGKAPTGKQAKGKAPTGKQAKTASSKAPKGKAAKGPKQAKRAKHALPKRVCCNNRPRCRRCPLRMLAEGTLPEGYTVRHRRLVRAGAR